MARRPTQLSRRPSASPLVADEHRDNTVSETAQASTQRVASTPDSKGKKVMDCVLLTSSRKRSRSAIERSDEAGSSSSPSVHLLGSQSKSKNARKSSIGPGSRNINPPSEDTGSPQKKKQKRATSTPPTSSTAIAKRLSAAVPRIRRGRTPSGAMGTPESSVDSALPSRASARLASKNHPYIRTRTSDIYSYLAVENAGVASQDTSVSEFPPSGSQPAKKARGRPPKLNLDDPQTKAKLMKAWAQSRLLQGSPALSQPVGSSGVLAREAIGVKLPQELDPPEPTGAAPASTVSAIVKSAPTLEASEAASSSPAAHPSELDSMVVDKPSPGSSVASHSPTRVSVPPSPQDSPVLRYPSLPAPSRPNVEDRVSASEEESSFSMMLPTQEIDREQEQDGPAPSPRAIVLAEPPFITEGGGDPFSCGLSSPTADTPPTNLLNRIQGDGLLSDLPNPVHHVKDRVEDLPNNFLYITAPPFTHSPTSPLINLVEHTGEFQMLDVPEAVALPWVPLESGTSHIYVPPGIHQLIASMKRELELEGQARQKAEDMYLKEMQKRIAVESVISNLREEFRHTWAHASSSTRSAAQAPPGVGSRPKTTAPDSAKPLPTEEQVGVVDLPSELAAPPDSQPTPVSVHQPYVQPNTNAQDAGITEQHPADALAVNIVISNPDEDRVRQHDPTVTPISFQRSQGEKLRSASTPSPLQPVQTNAAHAVR
ncbi:hypothetical protein BV22DRAFT_1027902 [Leucogyrophana mollusca]|uniref:Uncharacterized protein n=1 Tax=Leucogyrophana mollusca TaxID=85980 RepID=A0ACB8BZH0_9AGAM|nr:hypothetical protein BV22DRAFT_1027902 [Leucogyrophana mollusca]